MPNPCGPAREAWWPAVEVLISVSEHAESTLDSSLLDMVSAADFDVKSVGARWMADVLSS